jgi:tetratricopeptide (TPR) repeat protein
VRLAAALKDLVEWAKANPDDPQARYDIAGVLRSLGAYEEALSIYSDIATQWPKERYWSAIRTGMIEREQGHYPEALKALDDLVVQAGPQSGMPFHYHRAWTLLELNRPAEAVAEMDQGFRFQPNYAWAYVMRSCAYASQGQLARALEDQRKALFILHALPPRGLVGDRFNLDRASAVERELANEVDSGISEPRKESCGGYWREPEHPRARSPILPIPAVPPLPRHIDKPGSVPLWWIGLVVLLAGGAIAFIMNSMRTRSP